VETTWSSDLTNRIAVVTGGSRGIGFAAASKLASLGAQVVLVSKSQQSVDSAVNSLTGMGFKASGFAVDLADSDAVLETFNQNQVALNADILINSAGVMSERTAKTLRTSASEWRRVLGVNLDGTFNTISVIGPQMVERRSGRIINVSACLGRFSGPGLAGGLAPYRISKSAVNALTKNLATELGQGRRGILVDAMCPNHSRTDMGGPDAPRSAEEGAETIVWLATRTHDEHTQTGLLWEDQQVVPW